VKDENLKRKKKNLLNLDKYETERISISIRDSNTSTEVNKLITDIATENLKKDFLRRWWCNSYNLPPTDKRLLAYTREELMIEYMEYAIDNELIVLGKGSKPAELIEVNGEKIYKTGIDIFDEDEMRWANQKSIKELLEEQKAKEEAEAFDKESTNILDDIKEKVRKDK